MKVMQPLTRWARVGGLLLLAAACGAFLYEPVFGQAGAKPAEAKKAEAPAKKPAAAQKKPAGPNWKQLFAGGPTPQWIWGPGDKDCVLRKTLTLAAVGPARIKATCDNKMKILVNGFPVAQSNEWQAPVEFDIQKMLKVGENVVTVEAGNEDGAAAFVCKLVVAGAEPLYVVSDDTWETAPTKDAATWAKARKIAVLGAGPWGDVFAQPSSDGQSKGEFTTLPGFEVDHLFTVPKAEMGSWVCLTADDKGRIIACDQGNLGFYRITPPAVGSTDEAKVEKLDLKLTSAQGLLFAFGSLYASVNGGPGSGLYRIRDTNNDDQFDEVVKLKDFRGGGEHGPHALRLSPDGKRLVVLCGNHTLPPFDVVRNAEPQRMGGARTEPLTATLPEGMTSRIAPNWDEDLLLPRQWDAGGHAVGILAPGGWVADTDPDGKTWNLSSMGYRNPYDMAYNADGELFVYDADMEWDMGSPWYRPTRVCHATDGSEFGWRSGTGKWPSHYVDSLPEVVDIGPGSPVGVEFGYGTKFPAKYQKALYILDWTFGTIYAIHNVPHGASYKGVKEEFLSRTPLPLTDAVVAKDGYLYFAVGGRGTQSELFRVRYVGDESTAPADAHDSEGSELRALRKKIEAYNAPAADPTAAVAFLTPHLAHADRFIRYHARVALERQPLKLWQDAVLGSSDVETVITGVVGLARQGTADLQPKLLAALGKLDWGKLSETQRLELSRAYQLAFIRLGQPTDEARPALAAKFDAVYPSGDERLDRELCILLVFLKSPNVVKKTIPFLTKERAKIDADFAQVLTRNRNYGGGIANMLANHPDLQQVALAFTLRNAKEGWTIDDRKTYFGWFERARTWSGGNSYVKFLNNIDKDAFQNCTDAERLAVEALGARKPYKMPELPKAVGPGKDWTVAELMAIAPQQLQHGRDFKNGQKMFAASRCVVCHRIAGDGGSTGPDLTQSAGRFGAKDMLEAIIEPSKVISDQYKATIVTTTDGRQLTGRIVSESPKSVTIVVDPENSGKVVEIAREDIDELTPSPLSLMPKDLLKTLNEKEVLDLLAYLLSRGEPNSPMFRK